MEKMNKVCDHSQFYTNANAKVETTFSSADLSSIQNKLKKVCSKSPLPNLNGKTKKPTLFPQILEVYSTSEEQFNQQNPLGFVGHNESDSFLSAGQFSTPEACEEVEMQNDYTSCGYATANGFSILSNDDCQVECKESNLCYNMNGTHVDLHKNNSPVCVKTEPFDLSTCVSTSKHNLIPEPNIKTEPSFNMDFESSSTKEKDMTVTVKMDADNNVLSSTDPMELTDQFTNKSETEYPSNTCTTNLIIDDSECEIGMLPFVMEKSSNLFDRQVHQQNSAREFFHGNRNNENRPYIIPVSMYQAGDIMEPSMTAQKIKVRTVFYKKTNSETTVKIRAHVCSICGRMFAYQRALRKHIQSRHPETENAYEDDTQNETKLPNVQPKQCFSVEKAQPGLTAACSICGELFKNKYRLGLHRKFHSGKTLHECCSCNMAFDSRYLLLRHTKSRHGTKPLSSNVEIAFQKVDTFSLEEQQNIHVRSEEGLTTKCQLVQDTQVDSEDKYNCGSCSKTFSLKRSLFRHVAAKHDVMCINYERKRSLDCRTVTDVCRMSTKILGQTCTECKKVIIHLGHFKQLMKCSVCGYRTNCCRAFTDHMIITQSKRNPIAYLGYCQRPRFLLKCLCGKINEDDEMAQHITLCKKGEKSAKVIGYYSVRLDSWVENDEEIEKNNLSGMEPLVSSKVQTPLTVEELVEERMAEISHRARLIRRAIEQGIDILSQSIATEG